MGPQLRDIHLPDAPTWWPPAPGWWLLALLLACLLGLVLHLGVRWRLRRRRRRMLREELQRVLAMREHSAPVAFLAEVSQLLRRLALTRDPAAAALHGDAWIDHLGRSAAPLPEAVAEALRDGAYRRSSAVDTEAVAAATSAWLDAWQREQDRA